MKNYRERTEDGEWVDVAVCVYRLNGVFWLELRPSPALFVLSWLDGAALSLLS